MTPKASRIVDIYGGRDPAVVAAYSVADAASILKTPASTVRYWVSGAPKRGHSGKRYQPVVTPAEPDPLRLSFRNLVELHILRAIRVRHGVDLQGVRRAIAYLRERHPTTHPLLGHLFYADAGSLVVRAKGGYLDASAGGQLVMEDIVERLLARVEIQDSQPTRFYPYVSRNLDDSQRPVWIDPRISFGHPCLVGTGIRTDALADRILAGDDLEALAEDYGRTPAEILGVIRYELGLRKAA